MSIADPVSPAFALIDSTLRADSTFMSEVMGVYQDVAPDITYTKPYAVFNLQSAVDTNTATAVRMLTRLILQAQIVGKGDTDGAAIRSAFARMDGLLQPNGEPLRLQGGTLCLYRTGVLSYSEIVSGAQWVHLGGLYRVEV